MNDVVVLGELVEIRARQVDPRQPLYRDMPLVNGKNIESGTGRLLFRRTAADEQVISPKYLFTSGDVLYSKLRPYLRKVTVAIEDGLCSADMYPLAVDSQRMNPLWLMWLLLGDAFSKYAASESARARMPKLNREQLLRFTFALPSLSKQDRIAARLTEQFAALDRASASLAERDVALEQLRRAAVDSAFHASEGFGRTRLRDVASIIRGVIFDGADVSSSPLTQRLPILRAGNIGERLDLELALIWVPETVVNADQRMQVGDIAICMSSGSASVVGKSAPLRRPFHGSVGAFCALVRPGERLDHDYLAAWLRSPSFWRWRDSQSRGASIQNLRACSRILPFGSAGCATKADTAVGQAAGCELRDRPLQ